MTSAEPERDAAGRFRPGHGGRPKGSKNKRKSYTPDEFRRSVAMEANRRIEALVDRAVEVVEEQLEQGNEKVAIWALDRILPADRSRLSEAVLEANLSSLEGIVETAQTVSQMTAEGLLGLNEARRFLTILTNTAQLRGYLEVDALRSMVKELETSTRSHERAQTIDLPKWFNGPARLSESDV